MLKRVTFFLLLSFFVHPLMSQKLNGSEASRIFPGAEQVVLDQRTELPKYIKIKNDVALNIEDALTQLKASFSLPEQTSFELIRRTKDQLGVNHLRYQQLKDGVAILGGIYLLHTEGGLVRSLNGALYNLQDQSTQASISPERAVEIAIEPYQTDLKGWEVNIDAYSDQKLAEYPAPILTLIPNELNFKNSDFRLAYKMDVYAIHDGHHHRNWVYVDAQNGAIIAKENQICEIDVPATVLTNKSGEREVLVDQIDYNRYRLRQTTYGDGIWTLNMQTGTDTEQAVDFKHGDDFWGEDISTADRYAHDAHWAGEQFYLMLQDKFNRNSINEEGIELRMYVRYGENYANAFWNGSHSFYGDGGGAVLNRPLTTVDIVAHEFTHGLVDYTANLIYNYEPGALNESFADIFGLACNFYARQQYDNWRIGRDATASGNGFRSAEDPKVFGHPANYYGEVWWASTGDNGGVHINSGVQNHWYYLLSEGGSGVNDFGEPYEVEGIGWEKALQVAYRNLSTYLTEGSQHADAALFAGVAATDLYGPCSPEYIATVNAWAAVGVGEPISETVAVDFQSQRFFCSVPDTVQFYNNSNNFESVEWDFGDGTTSTEINPVHIYTSPGAYDVSLIVTSCDGATHTESKESYIILDEDAAVCSAYVMPDTSMMVIEDCSGRILDPGGLENYPNNVSATLIVDPPVLGALDVHISELRLSRSNELGTDVLLVYDGAGTNAPLIGNFSGTLVDQFFTTSGGAFTLRFVSNDTLNRSGFDLTYAPSEFIGVPEANFIPSDSAPELNEPITFQDFSAYPGGYQWDLGDGTFSFEASPVHQYTAPGEYTVTQIVNNCLGLDTFSMIVSVGSGGILNVNPSTICVTLNAGDQLDTMFTLSNGGTDDLYIGFPESATPWLIQEAQSEELPPSASTTINLSFDATNLAADTLLYNIPMQTGDPNQLSFEFPVKLIVLPFPQVNYEIESLDICDGTYQFTDQTINPITTRIWDFGDGTTSSDSMPLHQYTQNGIYDISLIACNDLGCDSVFQEQAILVNYCDTLTMTQTGSAFFDNCNGLVFDNGGPEENYLENSDYTVTIAPTGADFVTLTINGLQLHPNLDFLYVYDGLDTLAEEIIAITGVLVPGTQIVSSGPAITLRFQSDEFLNFNGFDIAWTCNGNLLPPEVASLSLTLDNTCANEVALEAIPAGNYEYIWNMGDGNTISTFTPSLTYYYQDAGDYDVEVEVRNALGSAFAAQGVSISEIPFALDFELASEVVNIFETITLEASTDITPASVSWFIPGVDTLNGLTAMYAFEEVGTYTIRLEVTDANGCTMYLEESITVEAITATDEVTQIEGLQIIPNPSNGQFNIKLSFSESITTELVLSNTFGQIVFKEELGLIDEVNHTMHVRNLPAGVYFLTITGERGMIHTERLLIQK